MTTDTQIASHLLRSRLGKLCVAITGSSAEEFAEKASDVLTESNLLEFRLDYLPKPVAALPTLKAWLEAHQTVVVVATCRPKEYGAALRVQRPQHSKSCSKQARQASRSSILSWNRSRSCPQGQ